MDLDVKTYDTFVRDVVPRFDAWAFHDKWHVGGTHPPRSVPSREEAADWLFARSGQNRPPFWSSSESREWTTWDGPADVGYVAVTTTWTVNRRVEWGGVLYEHVGPVLVGPRFEPTVSYEVFRPVAPG